MKIKLLIASLLLLLIAFTYIATSQPHDGKNQMNITHYEDYTDSSLSDIQQFLKEEKAKAADKKLFHLASNRLLAVYFKQNKEIDSAVKYYKNALVDINYENDQQLTLLAHCSRDLGLIYNQLNQLEETKLLFAQAQTFFDKLKLKVHAYNSLNQYAEVLRKQGKADSALLVLDKVVQQTKRVDSLYFPLALAYEYKGRIASQHKNFYEAASYHQTAYDLLKEDTLYASSWKALILNSLYYAYNRLGNHTKSIQYLEASKAIYDSDKKGNPLNLATLYHNLGNAYKIQGDINQALRYLKASLTINQRILPPNHPKLINNQLLLGMIYNSQANYREAINSFKTICGLNENDEPEVIHSRLLANCYTADCFLHLDLADSSLKHLNQLDSFQAIAEHTDNLIKQFIINRKALYYQQIGKLDTAGHFFHQALSITKQSNYPEQKVHILLGLFQLSRNFLLQKQLDSCQYYAHMLLQTAESKSKHESRQSKHEVDIIKVRCLDLLATYYQEKWLIEKTDQYKTKSLLLTLQAFDLFKAVKSQLSEQESEISLNASHYEIFDASMDRLHAYYSDKASQELIDMALNIIELRQNVLLKSAFKRNYLKDSHFIPMVELVKEDSLQAVVVYAEKLMLDNKSNKDSIFKVMNTGNENLINLRNSWKQLYPNYYQLVFEDQAVSLKETQSLLNKNQQLIAFHVSDKGTYNIRITKNNFAFDFIKTPLTPQDVIQLKQLLQDKNTSLSRFEGEAKNLHDKLFVANSITNTDLIIIPHRHLNYVPFEVLVEKANHAATNFSDLNYLVKRFNISYTFSVSLASYGSKLKYKNKKGVLAVAPSYEEPQTEKRSGTKLSKLLFNQLEAKNILDIFGGKMLADSNSRMQQVIADKNNFSGVHFAAHAIIDEANPDFSYLALGGDSANSKLFIKDLYNQPWQNEMVVLSACETATGHLMQGEGIISLGRAFTFSGAKSVVSSLWKINDQSTSELMGYFYGYLKQKKNKDEALRLAKLDFMANQKNQKLSHPYYWAAFVLYGDSGKMFHPSYFWFIVLGIGIIGFSIWFYKRKLKAVKN